MSNLQAHKAKTGQQSLTAVMALRDLVVGGELAAGERLYEVKLAERLNVSRTPLRSALAQLEQEGLLERRGATGFFVRQFTVADVFDSIEIRGMLEGTAARLAAERGAEDADVADLMRLLAELGEAVGTNECDFDLDAYAAANARFHDRIVAASGSRILSRQIEHAAGLPFASPSAFLDGQRTAPAFRRSMNIAQSQHRAVVEAIIAREGTRAEAIMREHARHARTNLEQSMNADSSLMRTIPGLALVV